MSWEDVDFPKGWRVVQAGDVTEVVGGGTPKTNVPGNFTDGDGHPWITPADLTGYTQKYISRGRRNLTDQGLHSSSAKYMPAGTVLFSSRAPIGYVAIASNPVTTNQGFRSFVPSDNIDPQYLYYALKLIRRDAEQLASGTTFAELSGSKAKQLQFPLAPIAIQRQVVQYLDRSTASTTSAFIHIQAVKRAIDRFRQAVLAAAFSGRLTRDWRDANSSADEAHIADGAGIKLPATWRPRHIIELCERVVDCAHSTPKWVSHGLLCVRTNNFKPGVLDLSDVRFVSKETFEQRNNRLTPRADDILFSREGSILGIACMVPAGVELCMGQRMMLLRPASTSCTSEYLMHALNSPLLQAEIRELTGGTASPHLNVADVKRFLVPTPPLIEQVEITQRIRQLMTLADSIERRVNAASRDVTRGSRAVLARAFRGELPGLSFVDGAIPARRAAR